MSRSLHKRCHRAGTALRRHQAGAGMPRMLMLLAAIALLLVGAAVWLGAERKPLQEQVGSGSRLLPGLERRINAIDRVRIDAGVPEAITVLERKNGDWGVQQRGGYPADVGTLRTLLLSLAQAERLEAKTANPELYARIGVDHGADARGVLVGLAGGGSGPQGGSEKQVIVGDATSNGSATYVRLADEAQAWLLDRAISIDPQPSSWLRKELTQIDAHRVARVEIVHRGSGRDGDRVEIVASDDGPGFELANLPKGRSPASAAHAEATAGLLSSLRLADVEPVEGGAGDGDAGDGERPFGDVQTSHARFMLRDGIVIDIEFFDHEEFVAAVFDASLDEARAQDWIGAEQAKAAMEHERLQRAAAADADGATADPTADADTAVDADADADAAAPPLAVTDPAADRAARLSALQDEVAALQQRFDGWAFRLPPYKAEHLTRPLDGYLAPKQ